MLNDTLMLGFIIAALVVLLIPGPGVLYAVARSLDQGLNAGLVSVLGLAAGAFVHVVAATVGLSAILLTSATAFGIVKLVGAGYLIYLGVRTILNRSLGRAVESLPAVPMTRLFVDGVVVSVFNPKIAIFFMAFLPQFVDPAGGSIPTQIFLLGVVYVMLAVITDGAYAVLAGSVRRCVTGPVLQGPVPRYVCGGLYMGLGVNAALVER